MNLLIRLRQSHPQKICLKFICNIFYYHGVGWYWYEEHQTSPMQKRVYTVLFLIANAYIFSVDVNQFLVVTVPDLSEKEKAEFRQFVFGNTCIVIKLIMLYLHKDRIKVLLKRFLDHNREFASLDLEVESLKKVFKYLAPMLLFDYLTLGMTFVGAIIGYVEDGIPIRIQRTLYPVSTTPRFMFIGLRFFMDLHWFYNVTLMITIDCICITFMVFVSYKFTRLQTYFKGLRSEFLKNLDNKSRNESEKEFEKGFIDGIKLHEDALWCTRYLQHSLGSTFSFQILESVLIIVLCLSNIVTAEHVLVVILPKLFYLIGITMITGCYMLAAGDITNEAALVPTAIFHCGWELNRPRRRLRTLVVMALMSSQRPVTVTAFGIISLSYSNFVMILRHSYSFFAVMYN